MKTINRVSVHPVDFHLLNTLKIPENSMVANTRLGSVLSRLIKRGYGDLHVTTIEDERGRLAINYHCKKEIK